MIYVYTLNNVTYNVEAANRAEADAKAPIGAAFLYEKRKFNFSLIFPKK